MPSKASKKKPKGRKRRASQMLSKSLGSPSAYRREEKMDMTPHAPKDESQPNDLIWEAAHIKVLLSLAQVYIPFMRVIKSARCMARTREKCPTSADRRVFCLSMALQTTMLVSVPYVCFRYPIARLDLTRAVGGHNVLGAPVGT